MQAADHKNVVQSDDINLVEQGQNIGKSNDKDKADDKVLMFETLDDTEFGPSVQRHRFPSIAALQSFELSRGLEPNVTIRDRFVIVAADSEDNWEHVPTYLRSLGITDKIFETRLPLYTWRRSVNTAHHVSWPMEWFKELTNKKTNDEFDEYIHYMSSPGIQLSIRSFRALEQPFWNMAYISVPVPMYLSLMENLTMLVIPIAYKSDIQPYVAGASQNRYSIWAIAGLSNHACEDLATHIYSQGLLASLFGNVCHLLISDEDTVLRTISRYLSTIERHMMDDVKLQDSLTHWKPLIGQWKTHLNMQRNLSANLDIVISRIEKRTGGPSEHLRQMLTKLKADREAVLNHCESTFNALMTSMSIVESGKAIVQAQEVAKLTQLAFSFIPLTFVAGIFGMNLAVSPHVSSSTCLAFNSVIIAGVVGSRAKSLVVDCMLCWLSFAHLYCLIFPPPRRGTQWNASKAELGLSGSTCYWRSSPRHVEYQWSTTPTPSQLLGLFNLGSSASARMPNDTGTSGPTSEHEDTQ